MDTFKTKTTIGEAIYAFKTLTDKSQLSDDSGWSVRAIYHYLLRYRARVIREKLSRGNRITQFNYQTLPCIELCLVDMQECPCVPASGCEWRKTKLAIPTPIGKIKSVTSADGQITYSFVEWERLSKKINSRIPAQSKAAYYTVKNTGEGTYLYLYNNIHRDTVTITAIFEDPLQSALMPGCDGNTAKIDCADYLEEDFIIDPDILTLVYDLAIGQLLRAKSQISDVHNDDNDNVSANNIKL